MNPDRRLGASIRAPAPENPSAEPDNPPARSSRKRGGFFAGSMAYGFELGRVEHALLLQAHPIGRRRFEVTGGAEHHFVDLSPAAACPCDCGDFIWRGGHRPGPCKHMLRCMLAEGDPMVLLAVATLVSGMREYAADLERRLRPRPIRITLAVKAHVAERVGHPAAALAFARSETGTDAAVAVTLGTTGIRLGSLVRDAAGVAFIPEHEPQTLVRAA